MRFIVVPENENSGYFKGKQSGGGGFCGDIGTCISTPCDVIFTSEELAGRIKDRSKVPVVTIGSFVNKKEVTAKTLEFFQSLE